MGWFLKNDMVVSSDKTKLLIVTTGANQATKLTPSGTSFSVYVCDEIKHETKSEKLLILIVANVSADTSAEVSGDRTSD